MALSLSACAHVTEAQKERNTFDAAGREGNEVAKACVDQVKANPVYAGVLRRFPIFSMDQVPLSQLMDDTYATPEEGQALIALHDAAGSCRKARAAIWQTVHPEGAAVQRAVEAPLAEIYAGLVQRQITWGEGIKRFRALGQAVQQQMAEVTNRRVQGIDQRHRAEQERRSQALQTLSNSLILQGQMQQQQFQNQQLINSMNRPVNTNCTRIGNSVNCTSY
jgi:hypothetical protein